MKASEQSPKLLNKKDAKVAFESLSSEERVKRCVDLLPKLLGDWENKHPHWQIEVLFWLLDRALKSLRHYIESGDDTEISWASPFVELHFPVNCKWNHDDKDGSSFRVIIGELEADQLTDEEAASAALCELIVEHLNVLALQDYTNEVAFEKQGDSLVPVLSPSVVEHIRSNYAEDCQQHQLERLFWPKSFGAAFVDFDESSEGQFVNDEAKAQLEAIEEPLLAISFEANGCKLRVIVVLEIQPLIANADTQNAYFPIVVGLAVQWDEIKDDDDSLNDLSWADLHNWSNDERTALWDALAEVLDASLSELGPTPEPEMVEAVISVSAQVKVTAPKHNLDHINQAVSKMLEHFTATGEVLNYDIRCNGKLMLENRGQNELFGRLLAAVDEAETSDSKGKSLEKLVAALFTSITGFTILERVQTESEEIDIWISNECDTRPFRDEGDIILVECKYWKGACGKNEFGSLYQKVLNRAGRCKVGFLISWNGFSKTFKTEMLRASRETPLIIPLDGKAIRAAVQSGNFLETIVEARKKALMV